LPFQSQLRLVILISPEVIHMTQLGTRAGFWTAALVAGLALWASGAPTVVYPLYARAWDLTPAVTTLIFAIYPLTLIPVLVLFGNLSDYVGRRAAMLAGLGALAAGSVAFGLAPDLGWVLVGRALMGVGVGLSLGPASAALVDFSPPGAERRATTTTTAATATGLVLATLVGGALVEHAPAPLHLTFWVLLVITLVAATLVWFLPRPVTTGERWRPRRPSLPAGAGTVFWSGALAIGGAYAMGAIYLALGAQVARDLVGSDDAFVGGAVISVSAAAIGVVAVLARKLSPRLAVTIGPTVAAAGSGW
jgi:MFS family permease